MDNVTGEEVMLKMYCATAPPFHRFRLQPRHGFGEGSWRKELVSVNQGKAL